VNLTSGEAQTLTFTLDRAALSFYDRAKRDWIAEPGTFEIWVGSSFNDIRLKGSFDLAS
jgi:beta-glucosidase